MNPAFAFWLIPLALAIAALAALATALWYRRAVRRCKSRIAALEQDVCLRDDEALYLVQRRLPAMASGGRAGRDRVPGPMHQDLAGSAFALAQEAVLTIFGQVVNRTDQTVQDLLLAVARKLQGLANSQQLKITEMIERHDDPVFLEDLMHIDHTNAQILRRAVGLAVVCRAWPGRQHNATSLHDVVRGAIGRILDYQRVHIVRIEDTREVIGRAVEPLVMTLAELLENATRSSHPGTPVQVHVQLTHRGLAFVIEDAGVGLSVSERERVLRLLNDDSLGVAALGSPPRFGLAACGALARRYGFSVAVDTMSAFGGVRAVVSVPGSLLVDAATASRPPAAVPVGVTAMDAGTAAIDTAATITDHGLPKRVRQPAPAHAIESGTVAEHLPSQAAATLSAFQQAGQAAALLRPVTERGPARDAQS